MKDIYVEEKYQQLKKVEVGTKFSQVYEDALREVLYVTSATALKLLFWILSRMDEDNIVRIRYAEKLDFIGMCHVRSGHRYSVSTVNRSINELRKRLLIVSTNRIGERKGEYFVNPMCFWKSNSQGDRTQRIKEFLEFLKFKQDEEN